MIDTLIIFACNGLSRRKPINVLHDAMIDMGATEEEVYLCIQAGMLLLKERVESIERVKNQPLPFGRK